MPRDKAQQRDESAGQGAGASFGRSTEAADESRMGSERGSRDRGERQQSMQTAQEPGPSTDVNRRQTTSPVYAPSTSPFSLMRRMAEDMDRMFEAFGLGRAGLMSSPLASGFDRDPWRGSSAIDRSNWMPQVESFRRGDKLVVRADLPGLRKEDVKVEVDDGILTISGERRDEREESRDDYFRSERSYGQFYRSVPLPEGVNEEQCEATFKDGVLEVTLAAPKETERKSRQIQIR